MKHLLGLSQDHLTSLESQQLIHKDAQLAYKQLKDAAKKEGLELNFTSSFRSFEAQKNIWNKKARGEKDLLDDLGNCIDYNCLNKEEVLFSIMRWSALPGMSRHHWGTDIDVYDEASLPFSEYQIEHTPYEVSKKGPFGKLHTWLSKEIKNNNSFGFFRPYQNDLGGVSPEMWHLSYYPVSRKYLDEVSFEFFQENLESKIYQDLELLDLVKENKQKIYEQYIINISKPTWLD